MAHPRLIIMEIVAHWIDTQSDPDFCIVARVEAFIAGWGLDEALKRSEAYLNAGADAILMHSKKADPSDIESFVKAWNNQVSIVLFSWLWPSLTIDWVNWKGHNNDNKARPLKAHIYIYVRVPLKECTCSHDL